MALQLHDAGYRNKLTPISGFCIQKDAAGVYLVRLKIETPDGFVARNARGQSRIVRGTFRQKIPHSARINIVIEKLTDFDDKGEIIIYILTLYPTLNQGSNTVKGTKTNLSPSQPTKYHPAGGITTPFYIDKSGKHEFIIQEFQAK